MYQLATASFRFRLLLLLTAVLITAPAYLLAKTEEEIDYVALAERLYADGHVTRAEQTLKRVDLDREDTDLKAYYLISGLIALQRKAFQDATGRLEKAIEHGETRSLVYLALAQAYFQQENYTKTLDALQRTNPKYGGIPSGYHMAGQCHWALNQHGEALEVLNKGHLKFPNQVVTLRQKVLYLVDLGLYHEALLASDGLMQHASVTEDDVVAVVHALRKAQQPFQVISLLEQTRVYRPTSQRLKRLLAHAYHEAGKPYSAGLIFESLSVQASEYAFEAAHAFKLAKRYVRALSQNAKVPDPTKRYKQRLSILLDDQRFFEIVGMEATLSRLGLLDDDEIRYALAYAHFKSAAGHKAKRHLNLIEDAKLLDQVSALRYSIATCEESGWKCL